jgi:hypothetical protein
LRTGTRDVVDPELAVASHHLAVGDKTDQPKALPVRRLQLAQWQMALRTGSPSTSMLQALQQQMALAVIAGLRIAACAVGPFA